jgi:hypothetical protein
VAKAYFLNAQSNIISIELNSGQKHELTALNDTSSGSDPVCSLGLNASIDKDVLGTSGKNNLIVVTENQAKSIAWVIEMTQILPDEDVQFLVFENDVKARQGSTTRGFTFTKINESGT